MSTFAFTYLIAGLYVLNAIWLAWHGQWVFAGYWCSAFAITVFSYLMATK